MGWLEFIASMTGSTAWPIALVIVALIFRKQITGLLAAVRRLTWGDKAIELSDRLDQIEQKVIEVEAETPQIAQIQVLPDERFQSLLNISPSAAILDSWRDIETKFREIYARNGHSNNRMVPIRRIIEQLRSEDGVSELTRDLALELMVIRNRAVHSHDVTSVDAFRFYDFSQSVKRSLEKLA